MNYKDLLQDRLNKTKTIRICQGCDVYETDDAIYLLRTDVAINLNSDALDTYINILCVMLLDMECNKNIKLADELTGNIIGGSYPLDDVEFNFMNTGKCCYIHDFKPDITDYFQYLFIASSLGYPNVYQKLLEMYGDKIGIDNLKIILKKSIYIDNNECRVVLMRYINKHSHEEDIGLL